MLREKLFRLKNQGKFRNRGLELFRVEALSDAVFAFSVSFLVASLEVPQTFDELKIILNGALPFFATVSLLFLLWYQQYIFFRRYGLNDTVTIVLNLAYLAVILFYVYPLKFLFSVLLSSWTGIDLFPDASGKGLVVLSNNDFPQLIILFSLGYFFIWILIYLMHKRAFQSLHTVALNAYEVQYTLKEIRGALWNAVVGMAAILLAWAGIEWLAGICYLAIPVLLAINQRLFQRNLPGKTTHYFPAKKTPQTDAS